MIVSYNDSTLITGNKVLIPRADLKTPLIRRNNKLIYKNRLFLLIMRNKRKMNKLKFQIYLTN